MKHNTKTKIKLTTITILAIATITALTAYIPETPGFPDLIPTPKRGFDENIAFEHLTYQVSLGPRIPGSEAHEQVRAWISHNLEENGWQVEVQESIKMGHPIKNVIGRKGSGTPWLILGAHYDTRLLADQDPDPTKRDEPVPGANDGASGVAVLVELARIISLEEGEGQIWLVFFDAEDNGNIPGWDWILGSQSFVEQLNREPDAAVILDMIGDEDLNIYLERNSTRELSIDIWEVAEELGYSHSFIPEYKYSILDDHTPFLRAGIPAADVIDFNYPYWHTTHDTLDKVAPESLKIVGDTIYQWTNDYLSQPTLTSKTGYDQH